MKHSSSYVSRSALLTCQSARRVALGVAAGVVLLASSRGSAEPGDGDALDASDISTLELLGPQHRAREVLVRLRPDTFAFVEGLMQTVDGINQRNSRAAASGAPRDIKVRVVPDSDRSLVRFLQRPSLDGELAHRVLTAQQQGAGPGQGCIPGSDLWLRDTCVFGMGYRNAGLADGRPVVVDVQRNRSLKVLPQMLAKECNAGLIKNPAPEPLSGDQGGNLLTTPDNVLLIGNTSTNAFRGMFQNMGYRDRTALLDTRWLIVGHVDEIVSVVPTPKARAGYVLAAADPIEALQLIRGANKAQLNEIESSYFRDFLRQVHKYLAPRNTRFWLPRTRAMRQHILDYLDMAASNTASDTQRTARLERLLTEFGDNLFVRRWGDWRIPSFIVKNIKAADHIAKNVSKVKNTTARVRGGAGRRGGSGADTGPEVVSYPQLFTGSYFNRYGLFQRFEAFNPNTVNQLVLGSHAIAPDPQIPLFRRSIEAASKRAGFEVSFLRAGPYHRRGGGIHCATTELRDPRPAIRSRQASPGYVRRGTAPQPYRHLKAPGSTRPSALR